MGYKVQLLYPVLYVLPSSFFLLMMSRALELQGILGKGGEELQKQTQSLSTFERCCLLTGSTKCDNELVACRDQARLLLLGDEFIEETTDSQSHENNRSSTMSHPPTSVVTWLEHRLQIYENQWLSAQEKGFKSTVKRKARRIKQYRNAINSVKQGNLVDLSKLPDPLSESPDFKSEVRNERKMIIITSSIIQNENLSSYLEETPSSNPQDLDYTDISQLDKNIRVAPIVTKTLSRKENYCIECKKMVKEFCKHYEGVHGNTPEGMRLRELNKLEDVSERKKLKTEITNKLRKSGNAEFNKQSAKESFRSGRDATIIPVKRFRRDNANQNNTVQCAHCEGFYKRRKFSQHLHHCKEYVMDKSYTVGNIGTSRTHTLTLLDCVPGASLELMEEIVHMMKPRETKDVALRDPLIMKYATEFHKTRRASFQKIYVSRVITDLARVLMRMRETHGEKNITSLEDVFNPAYFSSLLECILLEGGYDMESGGMKTCGLGNRLRSHIKSAAETAKKDALADEYRANSSSDNSKRKRIKHFLKIMKEKWANEVGRIFDMAVKKSRSEREPKLAAEEDIVKTCHYIISQYRVVIIELEKSVPGSVEKHRAYNKLLDLIITHIMCLIRRRPVDFKRALNTHYDKLDQQEDLINEIKNSKHMNLSEEDLQLSKKFQIFYVPGKGWKEVVPIALTQVMKEAMDAIQRNKTHVGIISDKLFVRSKGLDINPRECIRKVTIGLSLKKPFDMSGNSLRHHAGTFSKLHSSHPQYQDYLASALGHTLHIHKLHYEMPTSIIQKLVVCPVLHKMTQPVNEREEGAKDTRNLDQVSPIATSSMIIGSKSPPNLYFSNVTPEKKRPLSEESDSSNRPSSDEEVLQKKQKISRQRWTEEEKNVLYNAFGKHILEYEQPPRNEVLQLYESNREIFQKRSVDSIVTFLNNKSKRKQKNVTPEVKKHFLSTYRKMTNVPL